MSDAATALRLTSALCGLGLFIASAEMLFLSAEFRDGGLFSWRVLRERRFAAAGPGIDLLLGDRTTIALLGIRCLAAAMMVVTPHPLAIAVALLTTAQFQLRQWLGTEGADHLAALVLVPLFLGTSLPSRGAAELSLAFLAAVACVAYMTSGITKLTAAEWRGGAALARIMNSELFGHPLAGRALSRHPSLAKVASWTVIALECLFPLVLLLPTPAAVTLLAVMLLFHVGCALLMGLNCFVWMFAALYPAVFHWHLRFGGAP